MLQYPACSTRRSGPAGRESGSERLSAKTRNEVQVKIEKINISDHSLRLLKWPGSLKTVIREIDIFYKVNII